MKTMKIEKQFEYKDEIKKLIQIKADTELQYIKEDGGVRAIGPLLIKGTYETNKKQSIDFQEILQMDVFAPKEKLHKDSFILSVDSCCGEACNHSVFVTVVMNVNGLVENDRNESLGSEKNSNVVNQENQQEIEEKKEFEDVFEDANTTYTSYRMVVAKKDDTYASIAHRYGVDEVALRNCNHEKEIQVKTLVILP